MEDFVTFEIAKRLKDIGFECKHPFAMYNENGKFHALFTSADFYNCKSGKYREYYAIEDFDEYDYICPTISQVLKWLREEKLILIGLSPMQEFDSDDDIEWCAGIYKGDKQGGLKWEEELYYQSYEAAAIAGIEHCLDNLI